MNIPSPKYIEIDCDKLKTIEDIIVIFRVLNISLEEWSEAYKMAATFFSINPLLIIYLFAQKQFIEGIENTGITGE